jgi:diguanylate cyclase (GGDEF)-like protein
MVVGHALAGALAGSAVVALGADDGLGDLATLGAFVAALAAVYAVPLQVPRGEDLEDVEVEDAFLVAMLLVLPPVGLLTVTLLASTVGNLARHRSRLKAVFNTGMAATAVALAVAVRALLQPVLGGRVGGDVVVALVAAAVFVTFEAVAVYAAIALAKERSFRSVARESAAVGVLVSASGMSIGVAVGLAARSVWWAPLTLLPAMGVVVLLLREHLKAMRDRSRLAALLRAATDAHASVDVRDVARSVKESARALLHAQAATLRTAPPGSGELGAPIRSGRDQRWLVVGERHRLDPFEPGDQQLLDGLAAIGSTALDNAHLLQRVQHQAVHDSLTGLPNRLLFEDRLGQAVARGDRFGERFGVLYLDIDRFKRVNDSLGHSLGDDLLRHVAHRLREAVRATDTVARMGGDEFTVLLLGIRDDREPVAVAETILERLRAPFYVGERQLFVTASIGVARYPEHGTTYGTLLANADVALYAAKERGRDAYEVYAAETADSGRARLVLEGHLHHALDRDEIWVAYQPLVDLRRHAITGVEALVRWDHPTLGALTPDDFLLVAEETGLIAALDAHVLKVACGQVARWNADRAPTAALRVAVNLSARQLHSPHLIATVTEALATSGLPAHLLEIEVTERLAGREPAGLRAVLQELRALGTQVAMDDFGTGYSALSRLHMFPLDTVKIDQSFIRRIVHPDDDAPIVAATIAMAHGLGLRVTAEGVETTTQLRFLQAHDCDLVQGYLFGRPAGALESEARGLDLPDLALLRK